MPRNGEKRERIEAKAIDKREQFPNDCANHIIIHSHIKLRNRKIYYYYYDDNDACSARTLQVNTAKQAVATAMRSTESATQAYWSAYTHTHTEWERETNF